MITIYMSKSALKKMTREASRWYRIGIEKTKSPFESVAYPLSAVNLKPGHEKNPAELIKLQDIESIVITHIAIPYDEIKNYSSHKANFQKLGAVETKRYAELFHRKRVFPLIRKYPNLEIVSRIHTHPFSNKAFCSKGDMREYREDWIYSRQKGWNVSFSLIMTVRKKTVKRLYWNTDAFAVDIKGLQKKVKLVLIPDSDKRILAAKRAPFYNLNAGKQWIELLANCISEICGGCKLKKINRAWLVLSFSFTDKKLLVFLPPLFPDKRAHLFIKESNGKYRKKIIISKYRYRNAEKFLRDILKNI